MAEAVSPIPEGHHTVTPYLLVSDPHGLLEFVQKAFGAQVLSTHEGPDGRVMHAEFQLGDSRVMVGGASEEWSAMPAMIHLYMEDVDGVYRKALEAGAESVREPQDMFYGDRSGGVRDPFGNQWWIATHVEDVSPEEMARREAAEKGGDQGS